MVGRLCPQLSHNLNAQSSEILRLIMEKNPDERVQGRAHFTYAESLLNKIQMAGFFRTLPPEDLKRQKERYIPGTVEALYDMGVFYSGPVDEELEEYYRGAYGEAMCDEAKANGWAPYAKEALALYQTIVAEHAELPSSRGAMGEAAERMVFELTNLTIGRVAPDIVGADIDGVEFKLSDYRGKIVVLDFWGDW